MQDVKDLHLDTAGKFNNVAAHQMMHFSTLLRIQAMQTKLPLSVHFCTAKFGTIVWASEALASHSNYIDPDEDNVAGTKDYLLLGLGE